MRSLVADKFMESITATFTNYTSYTNYKSNTTNYKSNTTNYKSNTTYHKSNNSKTTNLITLQPSVSHGYFS